MIGVGVAVVSIAMRSMILILLACLPLALFVYGFQVDEKVEEKLMWTPKLLPVVKVDFWA